MRDTVIVGAAMSDRPPKKDWPPGHVQAFDVRTGKLKWVFHVIPEDGEFGADTWKDGSNSYTGNANVWTMMSGDDELGHVYLPITTPTSDYWGGFRKGDGLFADSLVAVNVETGKRVWHFQTVHHGVWDYDLPARADAARRHGATARASRRSRRSASRASPTFSIGSTASRCGRSKSARCRRRIFPARSCRRRSRFRPGRRRSITKASPTIC